MLLISRIETVNNFTQQYLKQKSIISSDQITRTLLEKGVQGDKILADSYERLNNAVEAFEALKVGYINSQEALNQMLEQSISSRKQESEQIINNIEDIIKPNAAKYYVDNKLEDEITFLTQRKGQVELHISKTSSQKSNLQNLNLRFTPIDKKIFAQEIEEFDEAIKIAIEQVETFKNELTEDIEELSEILKLLEKTKQDHGYSRTTKINQVWIDEFLRNNSRNQAHENHN